VAIAAGTTLGGSVVHEYVRGFPLGSVYRAVDAELGEVAVKVLHGLSDPGCRERFQGLAAGWSPCGTRTW